MLFGDDVFDVVGKVAVLLSQQARTRTQSRVSELVTGSRLR